MEARETISRIWNCRVNEHYGMTETGLAGAVGCAAFDGYHVWESGLFYEIIDPASGLPVEDGHVGEIVVTTLLQEAMPMIRLSDRGSKQDTAGTVSLRQCAQTAGAGAEPSSGEEISGTNHTQ